MQNTELSSDLIWPLWVRLSHAGVALGVILVWVLAFGFHETGWWHRLLGYGVIAVVASRVLYGFCTRHTAARLVWPDWAGCRDHVNGLLRRRVSAYRGHNPLGQLAVYGLWFVIAALAVTGWLSRTDAYWGEDWPVDWHAGFSLLLMALVALHVLAVVLTGVVSRQRLIWQMVTGRFTLWDSHD